MKKFKEVWKDIKDYEGLYQVSNLGRVKSLSRFVSNGRFKNDTILKPIKQSTGYTNVNLYKKNKVKQVSIHQLIAIHFLNHIPKGNKIVVDHIDNNRSNNKVCNLQILSNRENVTKNIKNPGINFRKDTKKWTARIHINGKRKYLGQFDNELDAIKSYQKELMKINNGNSKRC
jgi:hypothetical protein